MATLPCKCGAPPDWLRVSAVRVTRDGVLVVEGERKQEEEKEENGFKRFERVYGQFVRRFRLVRWHATALRKNKTVGCPMATGHAIPCLVLGQTTGFA